MQINFDRLIGDKPIAVRIPSKDDGELFLQEMRKAYPDKVISWYYAPFNLHYVKRGGVCYCPYLNNNDALMTHGNWEHFRYTRGYEIVEFADLLEEEAELPEADGSLNFLFGL